METAVILTHKPTGLTAEASERRTQGENRRQALFRLRLRLALEVRRPALGPDGAAISRATSGSGDAAAAGSRSIPSTTTSRPCLPKSLDVLAETGHDPKQAAACTWLFTLAARQASEAGAAGLHADERTSPTGRSACSSVGDFQTVVLSHFPTIDFRDADRFRSLVSSSPRRSASTLLDDRRGTTSRPKGKSSNRTMEGATGMTVLYQRVCFRCGPSGRVAAGQPTERPDG